MQNRIATLFVSVGLLLSGMFSAKAQIAIYSDFFYTSSNVTLTVLDSLNMSPLSYATVFLVPRGDSTITHFTLTDSLGVASLDKVTRGAYLLNIEMLGYKPRQKEFYARKDKEDLGQFLMQEDAELLEAAKVASVANPMLIKQDTIEYNAAAFAVSENDMLVDLLKKMPGMEVDANGNVKVNGASVNKITVGGKSFFFDDKKTALTNIPAKVVDKIRVFNKDSETAAFSGITDKEKEKVMDLEFKEEFKHGWFGNAGLKLGASLPSGVDDELLNGDGLLYDGNALVAAYNEQNQVTVIAKAQNVTDLSGGSLTIMNEDGEYVTPVGGIISTWQAGANVNSDAVKGISIDGMVNYIRTNQLTANRSSRTTTLEDSGDMLSESSSSGSNDKGTFKTRLNVKNTDRKKWLLEADFSLTYANSASVGHRESEISDATGLLNNTVSDTWSGGNSLSAGISLSAGVKDLGKKGRSLTLEGLVSMSGGNTLDGNMSDYIHSGEQLDLLYDGTSSGRYFSATVSYVEPLFENWKLLLRGGTNYRLTSSSRTAFDGDGYANVNDYYSSLSDNKYFTNSGRVLLQWNKNRRNIQFGASVTAAENELYSKSAGVSTTTGKDEWIVDVAPFVNASFSKGETYLRVNYSGSTSRPGNARILPVLNISNPAYITMGNIYLKSHFSQNLSVNLSGGKGASQISYDISGNVNMDIRGLVSASWFDTDGIRYAIPVNATKPSMTLSGYSYVRFPLTSDKSLSLTLNLNPSWSRSVSYQYSGLGEELDKNTFDYGSFMEKFWGTDASGSVFYSGQSGFKESVTDVFSPYGRASMTWRGEKVTLTGSYGVTNRMTRYSFDSRANTDTWDHSLYGSVTWQTEWGLDFTSDASYKFYRGYRDGYGDPVFLWSFKLSKTVKALTFSIDIYDVLNNATSFSHTVQENWYEDSYSLIQGRYALFGIKWNFGKMNVSNMQKAQSSMFKMLF